jgi:hypothetical protein
VHDLIVNLFPRHLPAAFRPLMTASSANVAMVTNDGDQLSGCLVDPNRFGRVFVILSQDLHQH